MIIRPETPADHQAISELTTIAFAPMEFSDANEQHIINQLRHDGHLLLSLVAVGGDADQTIVGQVTFSPVTLPAEGRWVGLGPISVAPDSQRSGIGSALVAAGLEQMAADGYDGCVLIGNPAVYGPMGFVGDGSVSYQGLPPGIAQWRSLTGRTPSGEITYAPAFS